jgi:hypothetical protein
MNTLNEPLARSEEDVSSALLGVSAAGLSVVLAAVALALQSSDWAYAIAFSGVAVSASLLTVSRARYLLGIAVTVAFVVGVNWWHASPFVEILRRSDLPPTQGVPVMFGFVVASTLATVSALDLISADPEAARRTILRPARVALAAIAPAATALLGVPLRVVGTAVAVGVVGGVLGYVFRGLAPTIGARVTGVSRAWSIRLAVCLMPWWALLAAALSQVQSIRGDTIALLELLCAVTCCSAGVRWSASPIRRVLAAAVVLQVSGMWAYVFLFSLFHFDSFNALPTPNVVPWAFLASSGWLVMLAVLRPADSQGRLRTSAEANAAQ